MTLLIAVIVGASLDHIAHVHFDPVTLDPKLAPLLAPSHLNRKKFAREGFLLVRGLLHGELLREAQEAGIQEAARSHLLFDRLFFAYNKITFNVWQRQLGLASVAFGSAAPSAAAALLGMKDGRGGALRILKDAFMAFAPGRTGCGWHVDDKGFWPTLDNQSGGINVWIALSPVRAADGGGLALAPRSHLAEWSRQCRDWIAPPGGGPPRTCGMATLSPECHARFEEVQASYDMEPGGAIFLHRGTFHRSADFAPHAQDSAPVHRYNIRYVPEETRLFDNGFEAVLVRSTDVGHGSALTQAGVYYPQAWPTTLADERMQLASGMNSEPSVALVCRKVLRAAIKRLGLV